jgi:hypothetical protein
MANRCNLVESSIIGYGSETDILSVVIRTMEISMKC